MAFKVELQPSRHSFEVSPDKTILQAGLDAGFHMPHSCRVGMCRTCRGTIKSGRVDYGDVHPASLSDIDKAKGYVLCCQARPLENTVIEVKELDGIDVLRPRVIPCRVEKVDKPTPDVAVISVRLPMNENFRFLAGQHIDVQLRDGKRRSYSIANSPKPEGVTTLELHVRHTPGGTFTDQVFSTLKVRDLLSFEGPLGTFYVREDSDKPIVMVASGTGFAPIKAMCEAAMQKGMKRPIALYWGCWTRRDLYMLSLPESWQHPNLKFIPVLSNPTPECAWTGRTGFVHRAVMEDFPNLSGVQVYACGAPAMVEAARADFSEKCGLPPEQFYADAFLTEAEKAAA
ncbi:CDP-6-deoxy-delta-3,4-glucoseen reductase [Bradyrhizobium jicamae]|uniref:CDP-6-deoxy-delta-3,4-glucoseen reductase n=1 Tax=Bradyrhizobium jicamae TaxID=280332 RepID=UPI001BADF004|nr:CDP-6-deoxy-delta-3,4-glucoseen reductase [Bradyrhizobium jicamae]MBR0755289.1 CDP-6-deoxy-delta-3,4-glucoseen reductase [Bradyrhizobium jicamae]